MAEKAVEALGGNKSKPVTLGRHSETHILGETFYSQLLLRFEDYVAKQSVAPVGPALVAVINNRSICRLDLTARVPP